MTGPELDGGVLGTAYLWDEDGRHRPGTIYACDARRYGADRHLCMLHNLAGELFLSLKALMNPDANPTVAALQREAAGQVIATIERAR